eukprot:c2657_g1_i1 orf=455-922(-)
MKFWWPSRGVICFRALCVSSPSWTPLLYILTLSLSFCCHRLFPQAFLSPPSLLLMAMFIRVKRKKTTYFLHCEPSETTLEIKSKLQVLTDQDVDIQRLILVSNQQVLEDAKTLADQKVENDAVVALTFKKDTGEWEDVDIEKPDDRPTGMDLEGS